MPVRVSRLHRGYFAAFAINGLGTVVSAGAVVVLLVAVADEPSWGRMLFVGLAVLVMSAFAAWGYSSWAAYTDLRRSATPGRVVVSPDRVTIDYPAVFTEPVTIAASEIRAVAVDDRSLTWWGLHWRRFTVVDRAGVITGCLWRAGMPSPLAVAAPVRERPNVVLLFEAPRRFIEATGAGLVADIVAVAAQSKDMSDITDRTHLFGAPPVAAHTENVGLFLSLVDGAAARRALMPWAAYRPVLCTDDTFALPAILPVPGAVRTLTGVGILVYVAVSIAMVAASIAGMIDWPLFIPLVVPMAVGYNAYLLWRKLRATGRSFGQRTTVGRATSLVGLAAAAALAVVAVVAVVREGQPAQDPARPFTIPSIPSIPSIPTLRAPEIDRSPGTLAAPFPFPFPFPTPVPVPVPVPVPTFAG